MGAIVIGLRPGDHKQLGELAKIAGRPPQELAGIYLEQAIREQAGRAPADQYATAPGSPDRGGPA